MAVAAVGEVNGQVALRGVSLPPIVLAPLENADGHADGEDGLRARMRERNSGFLKLFTFRTSFVCCITLVIIQHQ